MGLFTPGFTGRRRDTVADLPPGQYLTEGFPVLAAGPTPQISKDDWTLTITTEAGEARQWTWSEFQALQQEDVTVDIHCVTSWSKLGTTWRGVSLDTLFDTVQTDAEFAMAHSYGGYTTNVPLADLLGGKAWIAHQFDGEDLEPEHGGPARLLVPHLYFWKSAKWVNGIHLMNHDEPGFWEQNGYHMYGDPWREQRYW
jgi:DMSO/TMAO reductase YedYZ molybdopterin-dependent catalytic subunit